MAVRGDMGITVREEQLAGNEGAQATQAAENGTHPRRGPRVIFGVDQDQRLTKKIATMAVDQSALTDLLDAPRLDEDLDFIWDAMQLVMQALIDLEATQVIGAARYGLVLGSVSPGAK